MYNRYKVINNNVSCKKLKIIGVIASSDMDLKDARQKTVSKISESVRNIDSVYEKDIKAHVQDGKITTYGVIYNLSLRIDA